MNLFSENIYPSGKDVNQPVDWTNIETHRIRIDSFDLVSYTAFFDDLEVGSLELYEDSEGRYWLNNIDVKPDYQRKGIGLSLLNEAVNAYGEIYAATNFSKDQEEEDADTRHLSQEGAALVNCALRNGILQPEWCFNPRFERDELWNSEDYY